LIIQENVKRATFDIKEKNNFIETRSLRCSLMHQKVDYAVGILLGLGLQQAAGFVCCASSGQQYCLS
jgi:hypothetical protein